MDLDRGFTLGDWTVLPRQSSISTGDLTRHLEPKVMAVLVCLARAAPETVRRNEIFDEVWPRVVVQEEVLSRNISILRSSLALDNRDHKYIQTVPRVGYRLLDTPGALVPLQLEAAADTGVTGSVNVTQGGDVSAPLPDAPPPSTPLARAASLLSPVSRRRLALVGGVVVILLVLLFRPTIESGDEPVDNPLGNRQAPAALKQESPGNATALSARMMIAGYSSTERRGADYLHSSVRLFRDALVRDPAAINAHLGIANALALLPSYEATDSELAFAQALTELQRYVDAGGAEGQTHATAAFIELHRMHFIAAEEQFERAIRFNPDDAGVHQWYSQLLARVGRLEASAREAALAVKLDPTSPVNQHRMGVSLLWRGQTAAAAAQFDLAAAAGIAPFINPEPRFIQLFRNRQFTELVAMLHLIAKARGMAADWIEPLEAALRSEQGEDIEMALIAIETAWRNKQVDDALNFGVPLFLGDANRTFTAAVAAVRGRSAAAVLEGLFLPEAVALRAHPSFASMVGELGLTAYWARFGLPDVCNETIDAPAFCDGA